MAYKVLSGEILQGVLYVVIGTQSVIYNSITYLTGQRFRGVSEVKTFSHTGSGIQEVQEVLELKACSIEFEQNDVYLNIFSDVTQFKSLAIEFALNNDEMPVNDFTKIQGFSLELIDYPFYSFKIIETRL